MGKPVILPKIRDPRFITVRRGGTLQDDDHRLLAMWAADCAGHVLHHFEQARPEDDRPRRAIDLGRAWARGEITWWEARTAGGHANAAARDLSGSSTACRVRCRPGLGCGRVGGPGFCLPPPAQGGGRGGAPRREAGGCPLPAGARPPPTRSGDFGPTTTGCPTSWVGLVSLPRGGGRGPPFRPPPGGGGGAPAGGGGGLLAPRPPPPPPPLFWTPTPRQLSRDNIW